MTDEQGMDITTGSCPIGHLFRNTTEQLKDERVSFDVKAIDCRRETFVVFIINH